MTYSVAVVGASGYVGGELLRLIAGHPELGVKTVTANSNAGEKLVSLHPHLRSLSGLTLSETKPETVKGHDVVFLALPHAKSAEVAAWLQDTALVIDCGADFRLEDAAAWKKFYSTEHAGTWTYGMPELVRSGELKQREVLRGATRIAVPGCNVTAITLGLAPALNAGLVEPHDLVSILSVGTSGAGRALKSSLLFSEISESASAYSVGGVHRHTPEIEQNLAKASGSVVSISFTPVLVPMSRGILAVNTAKLVGGVTEASVRKAYEDAYAGESFIQVLPAGEFPSTRSTLGVNNALIGLAVDSHAGRLVSITAIDNLVKGTAGAAIQSMNLALGLTEQLGLSVDGVAP
jgi:N-acetyl-gamma-glutamyl-phosphate reductase